MAKVLRWVFAIGVMIYLGTECYRVNYYCADEDFLWTLFGGVIAAVVTYFLSWLIYKKVILYIVFGKKLKEE